MDVIYSLIPGMMFFGLLFVALLVWAVKRGQYEDMEGNGHRILLEDDDEKMPFPESGESARDPKNRASKR